MAQADRTLILALIDSAADQAERHYSVYTLGLLGALARTIESRQASFPRAKGELEQSAQILQVALVESINDLLKNTADKLLTHALSGANEGLGDEERAAVTRLVSDARDELMQRLINVAINDTAGAVVKTWRLFSFQVESKVAAGVSRYGAGLVVRPNILNSVLFEQVDRKGARWKSATYIRTAIRGNLLWIYVEPYLLALAARPQDLAVVQHDEGHENDGLRFSINGGTDGVPTFAEIRDQVFHPNSRALVAQV